MNEIATQSPNLSYGVKDYTRVTSVISAFSGIHLVNAELLKKAADKGTAIHDYIESVFRAEWTGLMDEGIVPYLESFHEFWEGHKRLYEGFDVEIEKRLYCDDLKITGKIDLIFKSNHRTYAIDWKTGTRKQKTWFLQGSAYRFLLEQNGYPNVDDVLFVQLKKGKATPHKDKNYQDNLTLFNKCLDVYRYFDMGRFAVQQED